MKWKVEAEPAYSLLRVELEPGEELTSEAGSMMSVKGEIEVKTHTGGGLLKGLIRRTLAGETLFLNTFIAKSNAEVKLAPSLPGDIKYLPLTGEGYVIQDSSYLAHHGDVKLSVAWRGLKGMFAEGELIWLKVTGTGGVWVNGYGGLIEEELEPGSKLTVDNFHFVALNERARWRIRKFGGWKTFFFGGEGIVAEVEGPARLVLQSRTLPPFVQEIRKFFKTR
jgi:uncharacterized protein (TIGR00266 family)